MSKTIISLIVLMLILVVIGLDAQDAPYSIFRFGGLNTQAGDFAMKPDECRIAHNIDWGTNVGSITKRRGYDEITTISGQDSAVGVYGAYYSDGTQQLIVVTDSAGVGYGNVYASPKGQAQFGNTQKFKFTVATINEHTYIDSFTINSSVYVISYVSDASAKSQEITAGMVAAIEADDTTDYYLTPEVTGKAFYTALENFEGLGSSVKVDTTTPAGQSYTIDTVGTSRIWTDFAIFNKPSFAMFGDVVFAVNGSHKGFAYNGDVARSWPLNAPGEPSIIPLKVSGLLDGEYRYTATYLRGKEAADSSYTTPGTISAPVRVTGGRMLLKNFQWVGTDTLGGATDTIGLVVYRTRANIGAIDQRDSAFLVDTIWGESAADLATKTLIDSIGDEDLGAGISIWIEGYTGLDSTGNYDHSYGAPTYLSTPSDLSYTAAGTENGVFYGIGEQEDTLGVEYIVTFIDTVLGIESAPSVGLSVFVPTAKQSGAAKAKGYRVGLPLPVATDSGIVRNLYRGHIIQIINRDSKEYVDSIWNLYIQTGVVGPLSREQYYRYKIDTVITNGYRLVAQISADSSAYTDTTRWDSLLVSAKAFDHTVPPPFLTSIFPSDGRMFGVAGSRLHASRLDSASSWGTLDFISLDESDGDNITVAFASRGVIRVLKNRSSFNVYQDANLDWNRREVSGYWGCIAGRSHAAGPLGHYYLSDRGVIREAEGQFLNRTQTIELVSAPLDNFRSISMGSRAAAEGFYFDQKYFLTIPFTTVGNTRGDTTYVYDERSGSWATWSIPFSNSTLYSTEDNVDFIPPDSMYFLKRGDSVLYQYGIGKDDNGSQIRMTWRSAPFGMNVDLRKVSINKVSLIVDGDADDQLYAYTYDESGDAVDMSPTSTYLLFDSLTTRYRTKGAEGNDAQYYFLELYSGPQLVDSDARVDGIVVNYSLGAIPIVE